MVGIVDYGAGNLRSVQKALLYALLLPHGAMKKLQDEGDFTQLMFLQERVKTLPLEDVWAEYLRRQGMEDDYYTAVTAYERDVLAKRK